MQNVFLKLLTAAGVVALLSASAQAADLPVAPPEAAPAFVPTYDWSGLYVGVHAGYGWGETGDRLKVKDCWSDPCLTDTADLGESDADGFVAGGQVGYNYQVGSFVFGAEADLSWSGMDSSVGFLDGAGEAFELTNEINWLGTVRGRAGVAIDRFLVYATAGVAFADVETEITDEFGGSLSNSDTRIGWTVGAGVEAFITPNLTARLEYLYVDLGDDELDLAHEGPVTLTSETDFNAHIVRGALNYKFNW